MGIRHFVLSLFLFKIMTKGDQRSSHETTKTSMGPNVSLRKPPAPGIRDQSVICIAKPAYKKSRKKKNKSKASRSKRSPGYRSGRTPASTTRSPSPPRRFTDRRPSRSSSLDMSMFSRKCKEMQDLESRLISCKSDLEDITEKVESDREKIDDTERYLKRKRKELEENVSKMRDLNEELIKLKTKAKKYAC